MREVYVLKKVFILLLAVIVLISCIFVSCSKKQKDSESTTDNLGDNGTEYGFETQEVTDENGEKVTDKDGKVLTTSVLVNYKKGKNGKTYAQLIGDDGESVTDKNGKEVTIEVTENEDNNSDNNNNNNNNNGTTEKDPMNNSTTKPDNKTTGTTKKEVPATSSPETTKFEGNETVPKTTDSGTPVNFSVEDQNIIKSMLEVPYLYTASYENSDGVPIEIATHTAVWMAEREGSPRTIYPSSPVVLNLFKYYGQTVVNFKTKCNDAVKTSNAPISYIKKDDTFKISNYTPKVQTVNITAIEDLGDNNFYKVTADVSGCSKKKVVAIVQKNRLEASLGFSIKALNWQ